MRNNVFFSVITGNRNNEFICDYKLNGVNNLITDINEYPGHLFIHSVEKDEFYKAEILYISHRDNNHNDLNKESNSNINHDKTENIKQINIQVDDRQLEFKVSNFIKIDENELKQLYAKRNSKYVGASSCSFYYTYLYNDDGSRKSKSGHFKFSRPIMASEAFDSKLASKILKDYYIIPEENDPVYAIINEEDEGYVVSLITERTINEDLMFIESEEIDYYRPYFYEFIINPNNFEYLTNNLEIGATYEVQLTLDKSDSTTVSDDYMDYSETGRLSGEVFFSASPPRTIDGYIEFLDKNIPKKIGDDLQKFIKDSYKMTNPYVTCDYQKIEDEFFKNIPMNFEVDSVKAYDVGQGNWVKIQLAENNNDYFDIVFDVGRSSRASKNSKYDKNAIQAVKELNKNNMFVLSHWDLDHISGIIHLNENQFKTTWIVPQLTLNMSMNAFRLAAYLVKVPDINCVLVRKCLNGKVIINSPQITLAKGKGKDIGRNCKNTKTKYNDKNNLGLILSLKNKGKKALLCGDCEYIQMPDNFLNEYDFMVASHHGAETHVDKSELKNRTSAQKTALFTVNTNCKSYPKDLHTNHLKQLGYDCCEIYNTKNSHWKFTF